ncbi:MAG: KpsF/GutQ family sugar-phosphate isomerase [Bacteroidaceae bacterium]|nr:KpsF/GutQ family sugar-phosphate isomerase [Bacteroidaceae bacterium]
MNKWSEIAIRCLNDEAQAIKNLIPNIDAQFEKAVELMLHCRGKVLITGVGKSGHIGAKIAATLSSTGTPSFYVGPLDLFHGDLGVVNEDDIVMAISYSGQTDELLRLIPSLEDRNIPIIGVSGYRDSLLARHSAAHICIYVEEEARPLKLAPTCSSTATLAMGDALACCLMGARGFKERDFARFHPGGVLGKRLLTRAQDVMRRDDLPTLSPQTKLSEAVILVSRGRLGLCVAVDGGRVVGLVTDGDIRRAMENSQNRFFDLTVSDIMTKRPKTVSVDTRIIEIDRILNSNKIHCVLVVDKDEHLLGIVDSFSTVI